MILNIVFVNVISLVPKTAFYFGFIEIKPNQLIYVMCWICWMTEGESLSIFWQNARVRKEKRENKLFEFLSLSFYSIKGLKVILVLLISSNLKLLKSPGVKWRYLLSSIISLKWLSLTSSDIQKILLLQPGVRLLTWSPQLPHHGKKKR